jgi:hypothetical protein
MLVEAAVWSEPGQLKFSARPGNSAAGAVDDPWWRRNGS